LKLSKSALLKLEVKYLSHMVGWDDFDTNQEKLWAVEEWTVPQDFLEFWAFLGLVRYCMQYKAGFAGRAQPFKSTNRQGVLVAVDTGRTAGI